LLEEGLPQTEIVKRLKVSKSAVSRVAIAMRNEHRDARTVVGAKP
jgi:predicted transcriptional regulator